MKTLKFTLQEVQSRLDCKWSATAGQNDGQLRSRCSQSWTAAPLPVQCWYAPDNITLCYFMHFGSNFAGLWNFCRVIVQGDTSTSRVLLGMQYSTSSRLCCGVAAGESGVCPDTAGRSCFIKGIQLCCAGCSCPQKAGRRASTAPSVLHCCGAAITILVC